MWQTITGVNFSQLDSWLKSVSGEDCQVCLPFELNDVSPVDGLKFTDFKAVEKKLSKLRMNQIPSSTVMMHMTEQIRNQYGQRKNQEFDQLLIEKVVSIVIDEIWYKACKTILVMMEDELGTVEGDKKIWNVTIQNKS